MSLAPRNDFRLSRDPGKYYPLGSEFAAKAAEILEKAGIPNLLWGLLAVGLVGESFTQQDIEFVIPDSYIDAATIALQEAGLQLCGTPRCDKDKHSPGHPVPPTHFHIRDSASYNQFRFLYLFPQSSTLWWLPDITLDPPATDDLNFTLTNSPNLPPRKEGGCSGPWSDLLFPVKTLKGDSLTEAVLLLLCRDYHHINGWETWWETMLICLCENTATPGAGVVKQVKPEFREFWYAFNYERPDGVWVWDIFGPLQEKMMRENRVPGSLPWMA